MKKDEIGKHILEVGQKFVGLHETKSNAVWSNKALSDEFNKLMKSEGWAPGLPYCCAFASCVWLKAYAELGAPAALIQELKKSFTPSVITSYNNLKDHHKIIALPSPGSMFFMQLGSKWSGHAGLVHDYKAGTGKFGTLEANTSAGRSDPNRDRNGDGIYIKERPLTFTKSAKALNLLGFLEPVEW